MTRPADNVPNWEWRWSLQYASPETVDWILLGDCEQRCGFCFGDDWRKTGSVSLGDVPSGLSLLRMTGTDKLVISGGEPARHRDFFRIIGMARRAGFTEITLSTKGEHIERVLDELLEAKRIFQTTGQTVDLSEQARLVLGELRAIDAIGLPLDGDEALHSKMRPVNRHLPEADQSASFRATTRLARELPQLLQGFPGIAPGSREAQLSVTIRTVLTRQNYLEAHRLVDVLADSGCDVSRVRLKIRRFDASAASFAGRHATKLCNCSAGR